MQTDSINVAVSNFFLFVFLFICFLLTNLDFEYLYIIRRDTMVEHLGL